MLFAMVADDYIIVNSTTQRKHGFANLSAIILMSIVRYNGESGFDDGAFASDLEAAKCGDEPGLSSLFRTFHPRLLRYLRAREPSRADDIAGETWVAVAAQIGAFEGGVASFAAWLFTIGRQRLADDRRTRSRRQTNPVAEVPDDRQVRSGEDLALEHTGAQHAVDFIVRHLTRDQADVVLLRVLGDLSAREVASVLGRDENWVRVTHHRAIARLKDRAGPNLL